MTQPRLALDLEGVLADTYPLVGERTSLTPEDHETWAYPDDQFEEILDALEQLWAEEWASIPTTEPNIGQAVDNLRSEYEVHLVTNTPGDPQSVLLWLARNGISVDDAVFPGPKTDKSQLDYDAYIDDNPNLAGDVDRLYLYDEPRNRCVGPDDGVCYYDMTEYDAFWNASGRDLEQTVVRIGSVEDAYVDTVDRRTAGATAI